MTEDDKIIQIIPAPQGMKAVYKDKGSDEEFHSPILCLGLTKNGDVVALDFSADGCFDDPCEVSNFDRLEHREGGA